MVKCPLLNLQECVKGECAFWTEMDVHNIVTKQTTKDCACAIAKLPMLLVEQLRVTNGVQASVESQRNEIVKNQRTFLSIVKGETKLIGE